MSTGAWIAAAAVVVTVAVGLWRLATDGRFRVAAAPAPQEPADAAPPAVPPGAELVASVGGALGGRATLLQFSSAFCAPCRATRRVLGEVADLVDGVTHVEVDAEQHPDATRTFGILRTPTTVVLDPSGAEVTRAAGAPSRDQVLAAVARVGSHDADGTLNK
ncbi:thioredoxin family protein [Nocardioides sp. SYSU D00065]|uniref:TlpA family protein disulfide reductase n=1 Tax=Nocardioides sp. SYSU D00065 TaxID=2817378 RepID=UPI001B334D64|nr:thioredoxin family protein [Nocardioides sp. SYSU D00065]